MAIFSFLKKDTEPEVEIRKDFGSQVARHRFLVAMRIVAIAAILIIAVVAFYISYVNKEYTEYEIVTEEDRMDSDVAIYIPYNGNVIKYSQDGAEAFQGNNNPIWNETFEMQNPMVDTCENYAAIGDFKGNKVFTIASDGNNGEIETKLPISRFCISRQGVVAVAIEDEDETKINLYSSSGELLATVKSTMNQSGYPVDITLSPDGQKLGVSYVRIEEGKLKSSVAFYNFGEVGQNETDNYVSGYDYVDTVIPRLKFINNDTAFAVGDNRFVVYKGSQKPVSYAESFINDEIQSVFYGDNAVGIVYLNAGLDNKFLLEVYNDEGELILSLPFDIEYTDIVLKNDYIIIYNETECTIYRNNGTTKYSGEFMDPVLLMVPTENKTKYVLVNRDGVQTIRLR